jgi:hypothetical protein
MSGLVSVATLVAALTGAFLLALAGFDAPVQPNDQPVKARRSHTRAIREYGLWCAIFSLLGAYVLAFV